MYGQMMPSDFKKNFIGCPHASVSVSYSPIIYRLRQVWAGFLNKMKEMDLLST